MSETGIIMMGKMPTQAQEATKSIELIITEDCNLRCKYCYQVGKNSERVMSLDTGKRAVDFVLSDPTLSDSPGVLWALSGGEAFLEIDLIDELTDYIINKMNELGHPWKDNYTFSFGSNGILYNSKKVQNYIKKNYRHVGIAITIDGTKEKHDSSRVYADGSGSYDKVVENVKLWFKQFPCTEKATKATFSHDDLPYLKDSIISLWDLGIDYVMANVVFEDVWQEGDDIIFENQLKALADYIIENKKWENKSVRFFDPHIGFPMVEDEVNGGFCGSGKHMISIDCEGKIYPCNRFTKFSLNNKEPLSIGDIYTGINQDKLRSFSSFSIKTISNKECLNCEVASLCAYCAGYNYDNADENTIFKRSTFICSMHKANVRACNYFWDKLEKTIGRKTPRTKAKETRFMVKMQSIKNKSLIFILDDSNTAHCCYTTKAHEINKMSDEIFNEGIDFANKYGFTPIILGDKPEQYSLDKDTISISSSKATQFNENSIIVFDNNMETVDSDSQVCILLLSNNNIDNLFNFVSVARSQYMRINIIINDIQQWGEGDIQRYRAQLSEIVELVVSDAKEAKYYEINVLTDLLKLKKMNNCDAGESSYTLAPNGKIYICPAFYFDNPDNSIGSISDGINIKNEYLLSFEHAPICSMCDAYQCSRCKFLNYKLTGEINTPSSMQCVISHVERSASRELQLRLKEENLAAYMDILPEINYFDPLDELKRNRVNEAI